MVNWFCVILKLGGYLNVFEIKKKICVYLNVFFYDCVCLGVLNLGMILIFCNLVLLVICFIFFCV